MSETSFKPYPCCRHAHAAVDAALELRERGLDPASVESVTVGTYSAALDVTDRPRVATPHDARFSLQYCVAWALGRGSPNLRAFEAGALADPAPRALLVRVRVCSDPDLEAAYPERWGARVTVQAAGGERVQVVRDGPTGDPDRPLDPVAFRARLEGLMAFGGLTSTGIASALEGFSALPTSPGVPALPGT